MTNTQPREVCKPALDLIKVSEGFSATWYKCSAGKWTIGYGTCGKPTPKQIGNLGVLGTKDEDKFTGERITKKEATTRMMEHVKLRACDPIERLVKVKLNDNQFGAIVSLVYNIGSGAFGHSTILKHINKGEFQEAADIFWEWRRGGGEILDGLVTRREAEKKLFLS